MTADEITDRVRALQAERARPSPDPAPTVEELIRRLVGTLAALYRTPPDTTK